jgi:hypothetical protein
MTKTVIQTLVIVACGAAAYISLRTGQITNQDASASVTQKLNDKIESYRMENANNFATVIGHVDAGQMKTLEMTEQIKGLADSLVGIAKSTADISQQNAKINEQNQELLKGQNSVLQEHTKSLKQAKEAAAKAQVAAQTSQVQTRRAIHDINTKPQPLFHGWFPRPTPTPRRRR